MPSSPSAPTSSFRKDVLLLLAIGAAATALIVFLIWRGPHAAGAGDALAAVPADSFLVASLDVRAVAESPIGEAIVGEKGERTGALFGVESIEGTCGFDPLPHIRQIVLTIPEGETHGDIGFVATGDLGKASLESCAKAVIAKRGGHATTRQSGSFTIVSDDDPRSGALAFRDGGPFLVGRGSWLDAMIDTAEGRHPSLAAAGTDAHHALRADLLTSAPDAKALIATAIVPRGLRDKVREEMGNGSDASKLGPSMDGVLAVGLVAFAIDAGKPGTDARFFGEVRCDGDAAEAACANVEKMVLHFRLGWSGDLKVRLFGLGPLVDGLETQRDGAKLIVRTHAPASDLAKTITRLAALAGGGQGARTKASPSRSAEPAPPAPDDVVKPAHP